MIDFMYSTALAKRYERMVVNQFNDLVEKVGGVRYISEHSPYDKPVEQSKDLLNTAKELHYLARKRQRAHELREENTPCLFWEDEEGKKSVTLEHRDDTLWLLTVINPDENTMENFYSYEQAVQAFQSYLPQREEPDKDPEIDTIKKKDWSNLGIDQRIKLLEYRIECKAIDMNYSYLIEGDEYDPESEVHDLEQLRMGLNSLKEVRYAMRRAEQDGGSAEDYLDMTPDHVGLE